MEAPRGTMIGTSVAGSDGSPVISMPSLKSKWMDSPCQSITQVNINHSGPSVIVNWKYRIHWQSKNVDFTPSANSSVARKGSEKVVGKDEGLSIA